MTFRFVHNTQYGQSPSTKMHLSIVGFLILTTLRCFYFDLLGCEVTGFGLGLEDVKAMVS